MAHCFEAMTLCDAELNLIARVPEFLLALKKERKGNMMQLQQKIEAVVRSGEESSYVAECLEIPVVTQGKNLGEVTANLREAVHLHLERGNLFPLTLNFSWVKSTA